MPNELKTGDCVEIPSMHNAVGVLRQKDSRPLMVPPDFGADKQGHRVTIWEVSLNTGKSVWVGESGLRKIVG